MRNVAKGLILAALLAGGCAGGYGTKIGSYTRRINQSGYTYEQIFSASRQALDELGAVTNADMKTGVIEGQIPPFRMRATCERDSTWLKLEGIEEEHGAWQRGTGKGEWFLSVDGTLRYRQGAETLEEAVKAWSKAINRKIP